MVQYIYKEPFNGQILNTMHNGLVDYTGNRVTRNYTNEKGASVYEIKFNDCLTFEQYNEQHGGNLKIANDIEIEQLLKDWEQKKLISLFTEITEERYFSLLECVPPKRYHNYKNLTIFFMGECYTSNIYTCCIYDNKSKKHYSALRRITETSEQIEAFFLESIKQ